MSLDEVRRSILVLGPLSRTDWNQAWRTRLLDNFSILAHQLWRVGIHETYIGGSFVEEREYPQDLDGYFVCDRAAYKTRALHDALNALDPARCWTWRGEDLRPDANGRLRPPMWHNYRVELLPYYGQPGSGSTDRDGREVDIPTLFRRTKGTHLPKGIVRVLPDSGPPPARSFVGPIRRPVGPLAVMRRR